MFNHNKTLLLTNGKTIIIVTQENYSLMVEGESGYFELNIQSFTDILNDGFIIIDQN